MAIHRRSDQLDADGRDREPWPSHIARRIASHIAWMPIQGPLKSGACHSE